MDITETFKIAAAIIASLGGGAIIVASCSSWLGGLWANRMLQNERAKHAEKLESYSIQLELLKDKNLTRHNDKLNTYRQVIILISEILSELELVLFSEDEKISQSSEKSFSINRNKIYGYISLVSCQDVMDKYNELIDYLIPVIYENKKCSWEEMRSKADALLNSMRKDLGISEDEIYYRGGR